MILIGQSETTPFNPPFTAYLLLLCADRGAIS